MVLSKSWEVKKLGRVLKLEYGKPLPKENRNSNGKYPVYGANGIKTRTDKFYFDKKSIIVGRKGSAGEVNLTEEGFWPLDVTYFVTFDSEKYDLFYMFYLLNNLNLQKLAKGVKPGINRNDVYDIEAFFPSIKEQRRIVKILDKAFDSIAKAKENAEKNLKNAKDIFESYLQSIFENKGEGWEEKKLGDVCETGAGGTPLKSHKEYYEGGNIPWLRSGEVDKKDIIISELCITSIGLKQSSARIFPKNTVLIAMYGATAGQVGILRFEASTNQAVCGVIPNKKFIPEFLYYKFITGKADLIKQAVGGAQPNISQIKIKNTLVPILSIYEQQSIITKLNTLSTETKKLEAIYENKLADLEELKKSILQKAFKGELTKEIKVLA